MRMKKPLLIVLTPVRNEAWILHAFLKATSLWADYIIIADQMSTDGSRDIYPLYEKVTVIDNPRAEMHQARTRQLLFEAAKRIDGDKILFALDADEFLSGDFMNTSGWQTIINSKPSDVFCFRWMNLTADSTKYTSSVPFYWAAHVNDEVMNGIFPDNQIHEWRLPWPHQVNHEYIVEDISFIHFARVNAFRQKNKERFYQVSTAFHKDDYCGVGMYRMYHTISQDTIYDVPNDAYDFYIMNGLDVKAEIALNDEGQHYIDNTLSNLTEKGLKHFRKLNIWDEEFCNKYHLQNPQSYWDKLVMFYLRTTNKFSKSLIGRAIDKILKKIY